MFLYKRLYAPLTNVSAALTCSLLVVATAQARSAPALGGTPWDPADTHCFTTQHGSVANICAEPVGINFPLVTDTAGDKVVRVTARVPNGSTLRCQALSTDVEFGVLNHGFVSSFIVDRFVELDTIPTYVPPHGSLIVQCEVGPGVRILGFDWDA